MTRNDIIALTIEAGNEWASTNPKDQEFLIRFAGLVAAAERNACNSLWEAQRLTDSQVSDHINAAIAAEREACAKIAEEHQHDCYYGGADWFEAKRIKAAIQERNKQ